jgi:hypothetical protein
MDSAPIETRPSDPYAWRRSALDAVVRWLIFVPTLALMPVLLAGFTQVTAGGSFLTAIADGQLLLVSAPITASALLPLMRNERPASLTRSVLMFVGILLVTVEATVYAAVRLPDGAPSGPVQTLSIVMFLASLVSGVCSILIAKAEA